MRSSLAAFSLVLVAAASSQTYRLGTAFAYGGHLDERGMPATGTVDLEADSATTPGHADTVGSQHVAGSVLKRTNPLTGQLTPGSSLMVPDVLNVGWEWSWTILGAGIGASGLVVADIDGDGQQEVVASGSPGQFSPNKFWYVLRLEGAEFVPEWGSLEYEEDLDGLAVAEVDGRAGLEIVVSVAGQLYVYDGSSFNLLAHYPTAVQEAYGFHVADLDGDLSMEAMICNQTGTWAYDIASGDEKLALPGIACTDVVVGETDGSSGLEIVIANGTNSGFVLDALTGSVEWAHGLGFGYRLAVADFDSDGMEEIAAGHSSVIQVWHGDTHTLFWERPVTNLHAITGADVDDDSDIELIFGEHEWGRIYVLDGLSGAEEWRVGSPNHGITRITVADIDSDGVPEIVWGCGRSTTGKDQLEVADGETHEREAESIDVWGPFLGLAHGDLDADGEPELVFSTFDSDAGRYDGLYYVYDARSKQPEYHSDHPAGGSWEDQWRIQVGQADSDAPLEIIRSPKDFYDAYLQCLDGASHELEWETELPTSYQARSIQLGDPDGDGQAEIGIGSWRHVYLYDGATGLFEWQSPDLSGFFGSSEGADLLRIADVDDDGVGELIVATRGSGLLSLDPVNGTVDLGVAELEVTALEVAQLDGDCVPDIVVGTYAGTVEHIDAFTGDSTLLAGPFGAAIDGLAVVDLSGDQVNDYVFALAHRLHVVDGSTGLDLWVSSYLGHNAGRSDTLLVDDIDADGVAEIWVNFGIVGHVVFNVPTAPWPLFADGFECGDLSAWSSATGRP